MNQVRLMIGGSVREIAESILDAGVYTEFRRICMGFCTGGVSSQVMDDADIVAELEDPAVGELVVGILPTTPSTDLFATFGYLQNDDPPIAIVLNNQQRGQEGVIEAIKALQ